MSHLLNASRLPLELCTGGPWEEGDGEEPGARLWGSGRARWLQAPHAVADPACAEMNHPLWSFIAGQINFLKAPP